MASTNGTPASDTINGSNDWDYIYGLAGNDRIYGKFGIDNLYGDDGNDSLDGGFQDDTLYGGTGRDTVSGGSGDDYIDGGDGPDLLSGGLGDDRFVTSSLDSYSGDRINGGLGLDSVSFDLSYLTSGQTFRAVDPTGSATFYGASVTAIERFIVRGTDYRDTFIGGRWGDELNGGSGNDTLTGNGGDDHLDGAADRDSLTGGAGDDTLYGGSGNDVLDGGTGGDDLYGEDGNDRMTSGAGNDYLSGGWGDDTISAGAGDDYINGGSGADEVTAGSGNDEIVARIGDGPDVIDGGAGIDRLTVSGLQGTFVARAPGAVTRLSDGTTVTGVEAFSLDGSSSADTFTTGAGDDVIFSYDGNDRLTGGAGNDALYGGRGNDSLSGGSGNDTLSAGGDRDTLDGGAGVDTATVDLSALGTRNLSFIVDGTTGQASNGTVTRNVEIYDVDTAAGNDTLRAGTAQTVYFNGGDGNDQISGGRGHDILEGSHGNDTVSGGAGNDTIYDIGSRNRLNGGAGDDRVILDVFDAHARSDRNVVDLGSGNDTVSFNSGITSTYGYLEADGGAGDDLAEIGRGHLDVSMTFTLGATAVLTGGNVTLTDFERVSIVTGSGRDRMTGGALSDSFVGNGGNDTLTGLAGDDWLYGGAGADVLSGGAGNDVLTASGDAVPDTVRDTLYGHAGDDRLVINHGDIATGGSGIDTVAVDLSARSAGVSFTFSTGSVSVNSTTRFSEMERLDFTGTSGADRVTAGSLDDVLNGGAGNDSLRGGRGNDTLYDEAGNDSLYGDAGNDLFIRNDATGRDTFNGGAGTDTLSYAHIYGSGSSVQIDLLDATGNDGLARGLTLVSIEHVIGTVNDDAIAGSNRADNLVGGGGGDVLTGRAGNDTLTGGSGADQLSGGAGADTFVFDDAITGGDQVTDFTRGVDTLAISRAAFLLDEDYSLTLLRGADPVASRAVPTFLFETDTSRLWFDADGSGGDGEPLLVATLTGVSTLQASDFVFV